MAPGASSHVYAVSARRLKDAAGGLYGLTRSQAAALASDASPAGEFYRHNKYDACASVLCAELGVHM